MNKLLKNSLFLTSMWSMLACSTLRTNQAPLSSKENQYASSQDIYYNRHKKIRDIIHMSNEDLEAISLEEKGLTAFKKMIPYDRVIVLTGPDLDSTNDAMETINARNETIRIALMQQLIYAQEQYFSPPIRLGDHKTGFSITQLDSLVGTLTDKVQSQLIHLSMHGDVYIDKDTSKQTVDRYVHEIQTSTADSSLYVTTSIIDALNIQDSTITDIVMDPCHGPEALEDIKYLSDKAKKPLLSAGSAMIAFGTRTSVNFAGNSLNFLQNTAKDQNIHNKQDYFLGTVINHLMRSENKDFFIDEKEFNAGGNFYIDKLSFASFNKDSCQLFNLDATAFAQQLINKPPTQPELDTLYQKCTRIMNYYGSHISSTNPILSNLEQIMNVNDIQKFAKDIASVNSKEKRLPDESITLSSFLFLNGVENGTWETIQKNKNLAYGIKEAVPQPPTKSPTHKP